jgi:hypothetical protein
MTPSNVFSRFPGSFVPSNVRATITALSRTTRRLDTKVGEFALASAAAVVRMILVDEERGCQAGDEDVVFNAHHGKCSSR